MTGRFLSSTERALLIVDDEPCYWTAAGGATCVNIIAGAGQSGLGFISAVAV